MDYYWGEVLLKDHWIDVIFGVWKPEGYVKLNVEGLLQGACQGGYLFNIGFEYSLMIEKWAIPWDLDGIGICRLDI